MLAFNPLYRESITMSFLRCTAALAALCALPLLLAADDSPMDAPPMPEPVLTAINLGLNHHRADMVDPDLAAQGHWWLDAHYAYLSSNRSVDGTGTVGAAAYASSSQMLLEARYGLFPALDLGITLGMARQIQEGLGGSLDTISGAGMTDSLVTVRWQALNPSRWPVTLSYVLSIGIPTGKPSYADYLGAGSGSSFEDSVLALAWDHDDLTLQAQADWQRFLSGNAGSHQGSLGGKLALAKTLADPFQVAALIGYGQDLWSDRKGGQLFSGGFDATLRLNAWTAGLGLEWGLAGRSSSLPARLSLDAGWAY
jgi:hypothetical protein